MKYILSYIIYPSGPFGVPDRDHIVIPGGKPVNGPEIHTVTGRPIGHATLPEYRPEDKKVRVELSFDQAQLSITDNYLTVWAESNDPRTALNVSNHLVIEFLGHLSLSQTRVYQKELVVFEDEVGDVYPIQRQITLFSVTSYSLERLRNDILECQTFARLQDKRLSRAIHYFQLGHLLFERRTAIVDVSSPFHTDTIGAAFLYLWKAASTVLGDPSRRQDRYQTRYRALGYDEGAKDQMDALKKLRDDFDVAHYSLEPQRVCEVKDAFGSAEQFVAGVIRHYRVLLQNGGGVNLG